MKYWLDGDGIPPEEREEVYRQHAIREAKKDRIRNALIGCVAPMMIGCILGLAAAFIILKVTGTVK